MRICFFANMANHANWREMFDKVEFYRVDIRLLRELGHDVVLAGSASTLDRAADLYYCWWWGHAPFPVALGALRRKPVVVTGAFDYATCREELPGICYLDRPAWQRFILRSMLRLADTNLFISRYEHDEVTSNLKVNRPVLAPLAVDTDFYKPDPEVSTGDYFFSVAWSSRTNAIRKGMTQTIEAFALIAPQLPSVRLIIAGKHGDAKDELQRLANTLGVGARVEFPGMISDEEKLRAYRECIAYVQPTLYEGFGHAIAEAVAAGCRVVTSDRGAVPEVAGAFAQCVDPKSPQAISEAMLRCVSFNKTPADMEAGHAWISSRYSLSARRECLANVLAEFE